MRRCASCGRWLLLAFQVEGEFVCEAARLGWGGCGRMRRRVLCGCWARLAFPRAREKKALVVVIAKIERPVNRTPARLPPIDGWSSARGMNTPDRGSIGEWSGRRERCAAVRECCLRPLHQFASPRQMRR